LEPDPAAAVAPGAAPPTAPGMFAAFKRGASDIPLSQSLGDALSGLRERNEKVAELRALIDDNRERIERAVLGHAKGLMEGGDGVGEDEWAAARAGLHGEQPADVGYLQLKVARVLDGVAANTCQMLNYRDTSLHAWLVRQIWRRWAAGQDLYQPADDGSATKQQIDFLRAFDAGYMERRLRFTIDGINRLYRSPDGPPRGELDATKALLYERVR